MPPTEEQTYREFVKSTLLDIKEQTTKTNGRVTTLESRQNKSDNWRNYIMGGLTILAFIIGVVLIPLAAAYIGRA